MQPNFRTLESQEFSLFQQFPLRLTSARTYENGDFAISWTEIEVVPFEGNQLVLFSRIYNANGGRISPKIKIDVGNGVSQSSVLEFDENGGFRLRERADFNGDGSIVSHRFSENGRFVGTETLEANLSGAEANAPVGFLDADPTSRRVDIQSPDQKFWIWADATGFHAVTTVKGREVASSRVDIINDEFLSTTSNFTALGEEGFAAILSPVFGGSNTTNHRIQLFDATGQRIGDTIDLGNSFNADAIKRLSATRENDGDVLITAGLSEVRFNNGSEKQFIKLDSSAAIITAATPLYDLNDLAFDQTPIEFPDRTEEGDAALVGVSTNGRSILLAKFDGATADLGDARGDIAPDKFIDSALAVTELTREERKQGHFVLGKDSADKLKGFGGNDTLMGFNGRDDLKGGSGRDSLIGGAGRDELKGNGGRDTLDGGLGRDELSGGGGGDLLFGGKGSGDKLSGGGGSDVFHFTRGDGRDTITDFRQGDKIEIEQGASEFDDLRIVQRGEDILVFFSNVRIRIEDQDVDRLTADDFLF